MPLMLPIRLYQTGDAERYNSDYLKPTLLNDGRLMALGYSGAEAV